LPLITFLFHFFAKGLYLRSFFRPNQNLDKPDAMQGKGVVRFFLVLLTVVTLLQFLLMLPTNKVERDAEAYAQKVGAKVESSASSEAINTARAKYLDSMSTVEVFKVPLLKSYTYQELKSQQLAYGLDLKGGMSVVLQVDLENFIKSLSTQPEDKELVAALKKATADQQKSQTNYVDLFARGYSEISGNKSLANLFARKEALKSELATGDPNEKVVRVLRDKCDQTADLTFKLLKERIDKLGVTGPNVSLDKARSLILVELPGIENPQRARAFLSGAAKLEFWNVYRISDPVNPNGSTRKAIVETLVDADQVLGKTIGGGEQKVSKLDTIYVKGFGKTDSVGNPIAASKRKIEKIDTQYTNKSNPLLEKLQLNAGQNGALAVMGYADKNSRDTISGLLKREEVKALFPRDLTFVWGYKGVIDPTTKKASSTYELYAIKKADEFSAPPLSGEHVTKAYSDTDQQTNEIVVSLQMDGDGAKTWAQMTTKAAQDANREIAITLDDQVVTCPRVNQPIEGGNSQISGNFQLEEATDLSKLLEVGKLPTTTKIIQESLIGPSLGKANIAKGFNSLAIAFLAILVFMIAYYAGGGIVAILALVINLFLLIGAMASLGTVLTLPGIAGIVLTIGMAVDANVIIYERIREELRNGLSYLAAIKEGFKHAANAIVDGNLTTLIVGIVLFVFGLGPIKGFATVLIMGILSTLFTGILVSRLMIETWTEKGRVINFSYPWSSNVLLNRNYNWMGFRKISYAISAALVVISLVAIAVRGFDLGIDFKGGYAYNIKFEQGVQVDAEKLRSALTGPLKGTPVVKAVDTENTFNVVTDYLVSSADQDAADRVMQAVYTGVSSIQGDNLSLDAFKAPGGDGTHVISSSKVGPTIADDIQRSSWKATIFGLLGIFLYIFIRFSKAKYGFGGVIALIHDTIIAAGAFALFHGILPFNMEIDQAFIAAILTLIGYSINDTVIVFDRIREYIAKFPGMKKEELINNAINSTLSRTIVTSLTVFITVLILFFFGGDSIKGFAFAMMLGVFFGTYSSIFIASPIVADLTKGDYLEPSFATRSTSTEAASGKGKGSSKAVTPVK
jgi:SecD/SecF fusion protein